jgi:hypothetical protein
MYDYNQDSIKICSAQEAELTKNYYIQKAGTLKCVSADVLAEL